MSYMELINSSSAKIQIALQSLIKAHPTIGYNSHEAKASLAIIYNSFYAKFSCIYRFLDDSKEVWAKRFNTDSATYRLGYPHTHNLITMLEVGYSFGEFNK